jgi:uncharacterized protein (TIGR02246 family)
MTDDAARLRQLIDRQEITDLIVQYAAGVDTQDYERLIACFAPDGQMVSALGVKDGIDAIRAAMAPEALAKERPANSGLRFDQSTHQMSNMIITLDGDTAHGESAAVVFMIGPLDGQRVMAVRGVRYIDEFVRRPEGWRIRRREHIADWQFGPVPLAAPA